MTRTIRLILVLIIIIQSASINAQDTAKLDKYLTKKMAKMGLIGMQVAYVSDGSFIWQGNYGMKEYGTHDAVNENTLFMIASCSKPITALGILLLADQKKLDLDKPANDYLPFKVINPNFPEDQVTIRMLLTHHASFKDNWDVLTPLYTLEIGGDSPIPLQEFLKEYLMDGGSYYNAKENFMTAPMATEYRYSNVGYALLGHIIENVSGHPFNEFIREEIFEPLGMNSSYWLYANIPHTNIARPHDLPTKSNGLTEPEIFKHYGYPDYPDGQIRTTASDYGRFINFILNKGKVGNDQLVSEEIMDDFIRIQYPGVSKHQAIAWNYNEFDNFIYYVLMPRLPSHTGADPGVATAVSFDSEKKIGAIIFTNSPPTRFVDYKRFYQEIMKRLLKEARKYSRENQG